MIVEVLLGVCGFNVDRDAELTMVNVNSNVQKGDMGGGSAPGDLDRIVTVELFQESSERVGPMEPE